MPQSRQRMVLSAYTLPQSLLSAPRNRCWAVRCLSRGRDPRASVGADRANSGQTSGPVVSSAGVYTPISSVSARSIGLIARHGRVGSVGRDLLARGDGVEAGVRLAELERDLADRPVAVLGHLGLDELHLGIGVLVGLAVQEDHDVAVLLDAPRFTKVAQPWLGRSALLDASRELREGDHRNLQLT